jgi:hypothetical protein
MDRMFMPLRLSKRQDLEDLPHFKETDTQTPVAYNLLLFW